MQNLKTYKLHIAGEAVDPAGGEWFESVNPYTGKPWALIPRGGEADVERAVEAADTAFTGGEWPSLSATARGALLCRFADLVAEHAGRLAETEVRAQPVIVLPQEPARGSSYGLTRQQ